MKQLPKIEILRSSYDIACIEFICWKLKKCNERNQWTYK